MLRGMTWEQFRAWEIFDELEPFGVEREDFRAASIVQALWNIARDSKKNPKGWPIDDFLLRFGDTPPFVEARQSLATQELLIDAWIAGSNATFAESQCP